MVGDVDGEVVRARRFEVVDDAQRVRAVFGRLGRPGAGGETVGFEVFDPTGSARAWLVDEPGEGLHLAFALGGNQVLVLAANEGNGEVEPGVSLTLCAVDGAPVLAWQVGEDGDVVTRFRQR